MRAPLLICLFLAISSTFLAVSNAQDVADQFAACQTYLENVNTLFEAKNLKQLPQSFKLTLNLSGRSVNDMGDVDKCMSIYDMSFVRLTLFDPSIGIAVFRGYCMASSCDADALNSNKSQALVEFAKISQSILNIIKPTPPNPQEAAPAAVSTIDATIEEQDELVTFVGFFQLLDKQGLLTATSISQISFQPFEEFDKSTANAAFIIAVFSLFACFFAAISAPILKSLTSKKQRNKADSTRYQTLINYNQNGQTSISTVSSNVNNSNNTVSNISSEPSIISKAESSSSTEPKKPRRAPLYWRIFQCWNIQENAIKMITIKSTNDDLLVFNGIRSICFMQVIFGHEFYLHLNYMANTADLMYEERKPFILFAVSCLYSVDVFFWLGGFFLAYVVADEKMAKQLSFKNPIKVVLAYIFATINRLFRILPCYFIVLMFYWQITPYLGASPTWEIYSNATQNCNDRWWQNLLLIDNLFNGQTQKCFGWGWYLSNDFQMYLAGMLLLIIYQNNRFVGKISIIASFVVVQTVSIWVSYKWNFRVPWNVANLGVPYYYDDYYTKPWTRSPPYFIGLFLGVLYKEYQHDKQKKKEQSLFKKLENHFKKQISSKYIMYFFAIAIWTILAFAPYDIAVNAHYDLGMSTKYYWPKWFQNLWFGSCRSFYVVSVTLFVIPAMIGQKDLVARVLGSKVFAFVQRLSFGGYLVHYIIIQYTIWDSKDSVYYNAENLLALFFSEFSLTLLAASIIALMIEIPIMNLSSILLGGKKPSAQKAKTSMIAKQQNDINRSQISSTEKQSILESENVKQQLQKSHDEKA